MRAELRVSAIVLLLVFTLSAIQFFSGIAFSSGSQAVGNLTLVEPQGCNGHYCVGSKITVKCFGVIYLYRDESLIKSANGKLEYIPQKEGTYTATCLSEKKTFAVLGVGPKQNETDDPSITLDENQTLPKVDPNEIAFIPDRNTTPEVEVYEAQGQNQASVVSGQGSFSVPPEAAVLTEKERRRPSVKDDGKAVRFSNKVRDIGLDVTLNYSSQNPEIEITKWQGEGKMDIKLGSALFGKKNLIDETKEMYEFNISENVNQFYSIDEEEGSFKWNVILHDNNTNQTSWTYDINLTGLECYYQPPLTEEVNCLEVGCAACNETDCWDEFGEILVHRPEEIVGAYECYGNMTGDYSALGGKNYATGKAFNIYKPIFIDANNNTHIGTISISGNRLTISGNRTWLENAAYPVIIDPTFGYTTIGGSFTTVALNVFYGLVENAPANLQVDYLRFYGRNNPINVKGVITETSGNYNIVTNGVSAVNTTGGTAGWWNLYYSTKPILTKGTNYLLGIIPNGNERFYYSAGTGVNSSYDTTNSYATPAALGSVTTSTNRYSIYATYTTYITSVAINSPLNSTYTNTTTPSVNFTVQGGSATYNCSWTINGTLKGYNASVSNNLATIMNNATALIDSYYLGNVTCQVGVVAMNADYNFTVDNTGPLVSITSPLNNTHSNLTVFDFTYTVTETNINLTNVSIYNSTGSLINSTTNTSTGTVHSYLSVYVDGVYTFNVTTIDKAGNSNQSRGNFTRDTVNPQVSITSPLNSTWTNLTLIDFTYSVTESNMNLTNVSIYNSTGSLINSSVNTSTGTVHSYLSVYVDGVYTFNVTTIDKSGNINQSRGNFTRDALSPVISTISPENNSYTNNSLITVLATITESNINTTNLSIYNASGTLKNSTTNASTDSVNFYASIYVDGVYNVTLTTYDKAYNLYSKSIQNITLDRTNPQVSIISPLTDSILSSRVIDVSLSATETNINLTNCTIVNSTGDILNSTTNTSTGTVHCYMTIYQDTNINITATSYDRAGNSNSALNSNITIDTQKPQHSNIIQSPIGNPSYGQTVQANATWTDNIGLGIVYFRSNFSGTWQNYTPSVSGSEYYYTIPVSELTGLESVGWNFWANDTANNINNTMPVQTFIVQKVVPEMTLYLNGTIDDRGYQQGKFTNLTAVLSVEDLNIQIWTNFTGPLTLWQSGLSPLQNITKLDYPYGEYLIKANFSGNENYTYVESSHILSVTADPPPQYSGRLQSPAGDPVYGQDVQCNTTWTDNNNAMDTVYFQSNYTGIWANYTPSVSGSVYYYTIPTSYLSGGEVIYWRYWANDTTGNINDDMPNETFTVERAIPTITLYLNGTNGDRSYGQYESANFTISLSTEGIVELYTNFGGSEVLWDSGFSPIQNITYLVYNPGEYSIKANYSGNENYTSIETTHTLTITDSTEPYLAINAPLNDTLLSSVIISINITSTDTSLNYTTIFVINSTGHVVNSTTNETSGTYVIELTVPADGIYNITATAYDLAGNSNSTTVSNITIDKTLPSFSNYLRNPDTPNENQAVQVNVTIDELHTDTVTLELAETTNFSVSTKSGSQYYFTIGLGNYTAHDTITYYWYANDSAGNLNKSAQQSLTVANQDPSVSEPSIDNGLPTKNDVIICQGGVFSDNDDEDSEQDREFKWYNNSNEISGQTFQTLDLSVPEVGAGDVLNCSVRVYDGYGWSTWVNSSNSATVQSYTALVFTTQLQTPGTQNLRDTYVNSNGGNTNYGTGQTMNIRDNAIRQRLYLMFNITSLPASVQVTNAQLCIYMSANQTTASASAYHVTDYTWDSQGETGITWNNQVCGVNFNDAADCNLSAESTVATTTTGWKCWAVTNMVRTDYSTGDQNVSMAIKTPEVGALTADTFRTKEWTTPAQRPYLNISYTDSLKPQYSNIQQSPAGNPTYGQAIQANATWTDNLGLSTVYFRSNFSGSWQNYTPSVNGDEYYYTIPVSELTGLESVDWNFWANDTSNNINSTMPVQTFTVQKASMNLTLLLNGTNGDKTYNQTDNANMTANISVAGWPVEIWANFTGPLTLWQSGNSPLQNITNLTYVPGTYLVVANYTGNENYTANQTSHILTIVDEWTPSVNISSPVNDSVFNLSLVTISVTATDLNLNYTNVSLINSTGSIVASITNATNGTFIVTLSAPEDDVYNITATAYDLYGNTNSTTHKNITIDTLPPQVSIISPLNNTHSNLTVFDFTYIVTESNNNLTNVSIYNSTGSLINSTTNTSTGTMHSYLNVYVDGVYTFNVTAYDLAGNINQSRGNFTRDTANPLVSITAPAANTYTNNTLLTVTYTVTEDNLNLTNVSVSNFGGIINSTANSSTGTVNSYLRIYVNSLYNITATTYDRAGNTNQSLVQNWTLDTIAPNSTATSPLQNSYTNQTDWDITFALTEYNLNLTNCTIINSTGSVVNSTTNASNGTVHCYLSVYTDGAYNITLTHYDLAGNQNQTMIQNITLDASEPEVAIIFPLNNTWTNQTLITFSYTVTESNINYTNVSIYNSTGSIVNSTTNASTGTVYSYLSVYADDAYTFNVTTVDKAGNVRQGRGNFTRDTTSPLVSITSPLDHTRTNNNLFTINYTVTESNINYTNVSIINSTGSIVNSTTNSSTGIVYSYLSVYVDGVYNITATTYDNAGNINQSLAQNITLDTTNPQYSNILQSPAGNPIYGQSIQANVTWTDNLGIDTIYFRSNYTGTWQNYTPQVSGSEYYYTIPASELTGLESIGWNFWANDTVDNINNTLPLQTFTVQKAVPTITLYLNGSSGDKTYKQTENANFTIQLSIPGTVELWTNFTGSTTLWDSGSAPLTNLTYLNYAVGTYLIKANYSGNENYTSAEVNYTLTLEDRTNPTYSNVLQSPPGNPLYGQTVQANATWTDNVAIGTVYFRSNSTGTWTNYTPSSNGNEYYYNIPSTIAAGTVVSWNFWANDTRNNINDSMPLQTFTVQIASTGVAFILNQTVYARGMAPGGGYDVFIPFEARYLDIISGQPIEGADCDVANNVTEEIIELSYNSSTGNYTGEMNDWLLHANVSFNVNCTKANYNDAANSTSANIWAYHYLWEWDNLDYGPLGDSDTHWLRREPTTGTSIYDLGISSSASAGINTVREFYYFSSGVNGSYSSDHLIEGIITLRMNLSVSDSSCSPIMCYFVKDLALDTLSETCAPQVSISPDTPTLIESNTSAVSLRIRKGSYTGMSIKLNCTSPASEQIHVYYNHTGQAANVVFYDYYRLHIDSFVADAYSMDQDYLIGPNQTLNSTRVSITTFNNTYSVPASDQYIYLARIYPEYPNSLGVGDNYVYNSTGQLWASDNLSAGAPNSLVATQSNQYAWLTETIPGNSARNETLYMHILDALMDNESLIEDLPARKSWNISAYTIFTSVITVHNVTVFTNYSSYNAPDSFTFNVTVVNNSGTFDISDEVIIDTGADTITFPKTSLDSVGVVYTIVAEDKTNPQYSNLQQSPNGNPAYGQDVEANSTWTDNLGLSIVYFQSNFSGTWQNYPPSANGNIYNYTIPAAELTGGEVVGWKYWANDTSNNINGSMTIQSFTVQKDSTTIALYLNGTEGDRSYGQNENANLTAVLSVPGLTVELWTNFTGPLDSWANGASPLQNLTSLTYASGTYLVKANFSGNENYTGSEVNYTLTIDDTTDPDYSNIIQSPAGNPVHGQIVMANTTWTDNVAIGTVYFRSNYTGAWQNYTPQVSGSEYYYTIPDSELTGGEVVGWNFWANDTSNNINNTMPIQTFTVQKATSTMALHLNGTNGDVDYNYSDTANFTAQLSVAGYDVEIWTNLTGSMTLWQSGQSPLQNLTALTYTPGTYLVKANFSGNENYTASDINHTIRIFDYVQPQYSNIIQSPAGNPTYGQTVQANSTWIDNIGIGTVYFQSNYTGTWQNYTPSVNGNTYNYTVPGNIAAGTIVAWKYWANDTSNNINDTMPEQTFNVQSAPTSIYFALNQSVYPQGSGPGGGYEYYLPLDVRFVDNLTGSPIEGATCQVINNETAVAVDMEYNASTGNYTGQINDWALYSNVSFNATCSKANYTSNSSIAAAEVWMMLYLWEYDNMAYGPYGNQSTQWLRRNPTEGQVYTNTKSFSAVGGSNLVGSYLFCGEGTDCSLSKDYQLSGRITIRLNVSVTDSSCKPYLCLIIKDPNLDTLIRSCGNDTVLPPDTPTMLETNFTIPGATVKQGYYGGLELHTNCTGAMPVEVKAHYNYTNMLPNLEIVNPMTSPLDSQILSAGQYEANYTIGPNSTLNSSRYILIQFNNSNLMPSHADYYFYGRIYPEYTDTFLPNATYIYNSTGQLWSSDNASSGAPNYATVNPNSNTVSWTTETVPGGSAANETLDVFVLDAIRDNEALNHTNGYDIGWNITVWTIFTSTIGAYNITPWTNYSKYGADDTFTFDIWVTNSSGTYNITSQVTVNAASKKIIFPVTNIGSSGVSYYVSALDRAAPEIIIESPLSQIYHAPMMWFNATTSEAADWCVYSLDKGENATMDNDSTTHWHNLTSLSEGDHNVTFWCSDLAGNINQTNLREFSFYRHNTSIALYLNGADSDRVYNYSDTANFTAALNVIGASVQIWANLSGSLELLAEGVTPLQNITTLTYAPGNYLIKANYSGNQTHVPAEINYTITIVDASKPQYSNIAQSPIGNPVYGQTVQANSTWVDNVGLSGVYFRSNYTGTWQNYTPQANGNEYYYNIPDQYLSGGKTIAWNFWANDTSNNINDSMPLQTFTVQRASTTIALYLNGTDSDREYNYSQAANITSELSLVGYEIDIWTNLTGSVTLWETGASPLQNLTLLNYAPGTYLVKANFSGNENYSYNEINYTLTIVDVEYPLYSNILQSPAENPIYGQSVQANVTWLDDVGLSIVYFRSNYTGTWQNYTAEANGGEYYYTIPDQYLSGDRVISWNFWANDTSNNINDSMPIQTFTVQKAATSMAIYLNGTNGDRSYGQNEDTNLTAVLNVSGLTMEIWADFTGSMTLWQSGSSPLQNITALTYAPGSYTIKANFSGNENYTASESTHSLTINDTMNPQYSNISQSPLGTPAYGQSVQANATWTDNVAIGTVYFQSNYTGEWANYTPDVSGNEYSYTIPGTLPVGTAVAWKYWANDTSNNINDLMPLQTFTVQIASTYAQFTLNQSVYPQGRPSGNNYDIYIPFEVRYIDITSGQPIEGADCHVSNNETEEIIELSYNSSTGNYTGQINDWLMYSNVSFTVDCAKANYNDAANLTFANVWGFYYLWEWENRSFGPYGNQTTHWLRKEPTEGSVIHDRELSSSVGSGINSVEDFMYYSSGVNGSHSSDYVIKGIITLRMNLSVSDSSCSPILCFTVKDLALDTLSETCAPQVSISPNTPTLIESNTSAADLTIRKGSYTGMRLKLNCASAASEEIHVYYNHSGQAANVVLYDYYRPKIDSFVADAYSMDQNYTIGPNQTLNSTRVSITTFNNTNNEPASEYYNYLARIYPEYPNSLGVGDNYVYNSTGQLWASDNLSAGAPNSLVATQSNQYAWLTETIPGNSARNETLYMHILDAIRDNETFIEDIDDQISWNISAYTIFTSVITVHNVTVFTNYSNYNVPEGFAFNVTVVNSSGVYDLTSQITVDTDAKTVTFPKADIDSVGCVFTVTATDSKAPTWSDNKTSGNIYSPGAVYQVNVTWLDNVMVNEVALEANFTGEFMNYSMDGAGDEYFYNIVDLAAGDYAWKVYANDTLGNSNQTPLWIFHVEKAPVTLTFYLNGTNGDKSYNQSADSNFTAILNVSGLPVEIWGNFTGSFELLATGASPLQNITQLNYPVGTYSVKANFSGNANYTASVANHTLTILDSVAPQYSSIQQSPAGNPIYGQAVQANSTWTDNVGLSIVYFQSNYTGVWANYTPQVNETEYYYTIPGNIAAGTVVGWNFWANDTVNNANDTMPVQTYTIQRANTSIVIYLNGTDADKEYNYRDVANFTAVLNISGLEVEIWTDLSGTLGLWQSGSSPLQNLTGLDYGTGSYLIKANFSGNENYTASSANHTLTIKDEQAPQYSNILQSPGGNPIYGQTVQANATWIDDLGLHAVYFQSNYTGTWQNYTASEDSGEFYYTIPGDIAAGTQVAWRYWANDTSNNINDSMPTQTYVVQKAQTSIRLYLDGAESDREYNYTQIANLTAELNVNGLTIQLWTNLSGSMAMLQEGESPQQNLTLLNYPPGAYLIKANFSGNENHTSAEISHTLILTDSQKPTYSGVAQSPAGNPVYGEDVQANSTWTDNTGLGTVYFQSNFSGSWQNYGPEFNGDEYYYTIPFSELTGLESVGWKFWANDTSGNINDSMPVQAFMVQKASTNMTLFLNGTEGNYTYDRGETANFTAVLNIEGNVQLWTNLSGTLALWDEGTSPLQNLTLLDYGYGTYLIKANFSGNENYTASETEHYFIITDKVNPEYSDISQSPAGDPTYGNSVECNATWTDNVAIGTVYFRSNFSGTWQNYIAQVSGNEYYYTLPVSELTGLESVGWKFWANDTVNNINNTMPVQIFTVQKAVPTIAMYLNGTDSDRSYGQNENANFTAELGTSGTVQLYTNFTGSETLWDGGDSPLQNITNMSYPIGTYLIKANFSGDENYTSAEISHTITVIDATAPQYSNVIQSSSGDPIYGQDVMANSTWTDDNGLDTIYFQSNYTGSWQNYTPSVSGSEYYYNLPTSYLPGGKVVSWKYWANDTSENVNDAMPVQTFTVQKANTSIALYLDGVDADRNYSANTIANFTANLSLEGMQIEIWTNLSGSMELQESGQSPLQNLTHIDYSFGYYQIKANFSGNENYSSSEAIHTLGIFPPPPVIYLEGPMNRSGDPDGSLTFYYNVSDASGISSCRLVLNGVLNQTDDSVQTGTSQNFTLNNLGAAKYAWSIRCTNNWAIQADSEERWISVILMDSLDGETTDITQIDTSGMVQFTLEKSGYGKVVFNDTLNLENGSNLNSRVAIGSGYVSVNSLGEPHINKSAQISIHNLSYQEIPVVLRDGAYCSDCIVGSYLGGTLTFDATHFTNYTVASNSLSEIWDETDARGGSQLKYATEEVMFYANYTNTTSGDPITDGDAYCEIIFSDLTTHMAYNASSKLYEFNRSFAEDGNYSWNVSCNGSSIGYEIINLSDYVRIQTPYLEVTLTIPPTIPGNGEPNNEGDYLIGQNKTFVIKANATCRGGVCGTVQGFIRYNLSSASPDTNLSAYPDGPIYVVNSSEGAAENPIYCGTLGENDSCAVNWTVNATGSMNSVWAIDVGFNKTRISNHTQDVSIKITKVLIMSLSFNEINFGIVNPATPADQNPSPTNGNQIIQIDENSNDIGWLWVKGTDLQPQSLAGYGNISYKIGVENILWHNSSAYSSSKPLAQDYQMIDYNVRSGTNYGLYFWINAPGGLEAQEYRGTLYILANATAD